MHSRRRLLSIEEASDTAETDGQSAGFFAKCALPSTKTIVENAWFHRFVLVSIVASCSMLATYNPLDEAANAWLSVAEYVFQTVFTLEMMIKLKALGCRAYWKDGWNRLDGVIVIFGWIAFIPIDFGDSGNTSIFRVCHLSNVRYILGRCRC